MKPTATRVVEVYPKKTLLTRRTQWRWRVVSPNGRKMAHSGESYNNFAECLDGASWVLGLTKHLASRLVDKSVVLDAGTMYTWNVYD